MPSGSVRHGEMYPRHRGDELGHFRREMAGATGLEPATYGVTGRHSNQLSYAPAFHAKGAGLGGASAQVKER